MAITRILREKAIGETRWAALDGSGRPVAVRIDRWSDMKTRTHLCSLREARLRSLHPRQGGGFVELPGGSEAFIRLGEAHGLVEGQALIVRVVAEARSGKLARVETAPQKSENRSPSDTWQSNLPGGAALQVEDVAVGNPEIDAAFEEAAVEIVTLQGGGTLRIQPTAALVAADLDTAGRNDNGRAAARALRINLEAAGELARQISLRNLGGAIVLDCVSPINRDAGQKVRNGFLSAFSEVSNRSVKALPPSMFGLLEASIAWGETPIAERLHESTGNPTDETLCLEGLRHLQREARAQPMARLTLSLPIRVFDWMSGCGLDLQRHLDETFGARLTISPSPKAKPEIFQT